MYTLATMLMIFDSIIRQILDQQIGIHVHGACFVYVYVCVPRMRILYNLVSSKCKFVAVLTGTISDCLIKDPRGFPLQK